MGKQISLTDEVVKFFAGHTVLLVSTMDAGGRIHGAVKGLVDIRKEGVACILDLYSGGTLRNLKKNAVISITSVDEHTFQGYVLQGQAKILSIEDIDPALEKEWEKRLAERATQRIVKSMHRGSKSSQHHEMHLPKKPKHLYEIRIENVINLSPPSAKKKTV